jgi:uncharacterized membrane protein
MTDNSSSIPVISSRSAAVTANRFVYWLSRHWLLVFGLLWGLYVGLPWLAPLFMKWGWTTAANGIYLFYSTQCHQLPQRSYFLFGPKATYSLAEIQAAWQNTSNPAVLRQFVGNAEMGWKVAWSDRMVSLYTGLLLWGFLFDLLRRRIKPFPLWAVAMLLLPMVIDGTTHMISDFAGIGLGIRDNNTWLSVLTFHRLPANFYAGDALGSFNSWARLVSGLLFSLGLVGWLFPQLEASFGDAAHQIESKFRQAGIGL